MTCIVIPMLIFGLLVQPANSSTGAVDIDNDITFYNQAMTLYTNLVDNIRNLIPEMPSSLLKLDYTIPPSEESSWFSWDSWTNWWNNLKSSEQNYNDFMEWFLAKMEKGIDWAGGDPRVPSTIALICRDAVYSNTNLLGITPNDRLEILANILDTMKHISEPILKKTYPAELSGDIETIKQKLLNLETMIQSINNFYEAHTKLVLKAQQPDLKEQFGKLYVDVTGSGLSGYLRVDFKSRARTPIIEQALRARLSPNGGLLSAAGTGASELLGGITNWATSDWSLSWKNYPILNSAATKAFSVINILNFFSLTIYHLATIVRMPSRVNANVIQEIKGMQKLTDAAIVILSQKQLDPIATGIDNSRNEVETSIERLNYITTKSTELQTVEYLKSSIQNELDGFMKAEGAMNTALGNDDNKPYTLIIEILESLYHVTLQQEEKSAVQNGTGGDQ